LAARIHLHRPDAPPLLQQFVWQDHALSPGSLLVLVDFLDHRRHEVEAALHSCDRAPPKDPADRVARGG
jgi:uncharacterized protein Usg